MKQYWLLPGTFVTICMLSSPALAGRLESWRFDANQNRLEFTTDDGVQPKAQLIFNPTRLVIDLPGIDFGRPQQARAVGKEIRWIRVGQFESNTTRIVVELAPGYTINPQAVRFQGNSPRRWTVQLPSPEIDRNNPSSRSPLPPSSGNVGQSGRTRIENLVVTGDGLFLRTSGGSPQIRGQRSDNGRTISFDITDATLSPSLRQRDIPVNRYGVSTVQFTDLPGRSPTVRMTMRVNENTSDWQANASSGGGIVFLPGSSADLPRGNFPPPRTDGGGSRPFPSPTPTLPPRDVPPRGETATIESVDLVDGGSRLVIRANDRLTATSGWDRSSGFFRINITNARLAPSVRGPSLQAGSPIQRLRLQQIDPRTVAIFVQPAIGVQIEELNQISDRSLALELKGTRRNTPPGSVGLPPINQPNYPNPNIPDRQPGGTFPPNTGPISGRVVIIVDPGHGAQDPGAIGIGGLQEKDVILPIGIRVAQILQQNGVSAVMTRNSDFFVSLQGRVDIAERANATAFVSIHANSLGLERPDVNGLEVYYYDSGLELARYVRQSILNTVNVRDRGIRRARFYVLRKTSMPSILVETGYVTGREDAARLRTPEHQAQMADAIARGILEYLRRR